MTPPLFSILMSLYAKEQPAYLDSCLASLCAQTLPTDDIVLVLDGPIGDELQAIIRRYQARLPLHLVPLPKNEGLGRALNAGLMQCQHEWILRMDTDDVCQPNRCAQQMAYIQAHPEVVLFSGQVAEFNHDPHVLSAIKSVPTEHQAIVCYAQKRNPFNHMAMAYRKSAVLAVGGYQHHLGMEDYNLWLRLLAAGHHSHNLPDVLVHVRAGHNMHARRRGLGYIHSEWQLLQLKRQLRFQAALPAYVYFLLRSASRLLPTVALSTLYRFLRHSPTHSTS